MNILRTITAHLEHDWQDILEDKFVVRDLLPKMSTATKKTLVDNLINNIDGFENKRHILESPQILDVVNYIVLTKINKTISKQKRKHDESFSNPILISSKIVSILSDDIFLEKDYDCQDCLKQAKALLIENEMKNKIDSKFNEQKVCRYLNILKKFPIIFSSEKNQKICLLYFFALHKDLSYDVSKGQYKNLQLDIEKYILGKSLY